MMDKEGVKYREKSTEKSRTLDRRGSKTKHSSTSLNRPSSSYDLSSTFRNKSDRSRNLITKGDPRQGDTQASLHSLLSVKSVSIHPEVTHFRYQQYVDR
jgi:hypothetical protein